MSSQDKNEEIAAARERLKLPPRFERATLANFEKDLQKTAFDIADRFTKTYSPTTRRGIYFYGLPGSGKTHLASGIANDLLLKGRPRFTTSPELLLHIRKTYSTGNSDEEYIDRMSYSKLLIIDDLGSEKPTEWVLETLFVIIDRRYTNYLPTIFTSNYSLDQLKERLGYRIASRIAEMTEVVELRPVDYRIKKK